MIFYITNRRGGLRVRRDNNNKNSTYGSLEDTLIAPIRFRRLLHLLLRRLRIDDAVLARNLVAILLPVLALDALVRVELRLEKGAQRLKLGLLGLAGSIGGAGEVALKAFDAVLDRRVADLRLAHILLELAIGLGVSGAEGALM